ncbi:MAG: family 16 glycosylhydrolase, partial [Bacteroidota bacterium]
FSHIPKTDRFKDTQPITTLATVSATGSCTYTFSEASIAGTWTNLLDEQFTNLNNWNIWNSGAYNNELQLYRSQNLVLTGGNLQIVAKKETVTGISQPGSTTTKRFNYTSGRIESKVLYSANATNPKIRMVARIKLPAGYGMWPAFWSSGDPWPTQGEIAIMEAKGQEPSTYYTNYFYGTAVNTNLVSGATTTVNSSVSLQSCFHVYELVWEATKLSFYLDGQLVDTKTGTYVNALFGKSEKVVLNLAVGGNFFTSLITRNIVPGTMEIDWVKVYRSN